MSYIMEEYMRFTISLPKESYEEFERFRESLGVSRSDFVRKAMKAFIVNEQNLQVASQKVVGCISLIMKHEHFGLGQEDKEHEHDNKSDHDHEHFHNHEYGSQPIYASVQQTDEILKNDIQHHFHDIIISTMHVHLEFEKCLEIIAVSGLFKKVQALKNDLQRLKSILSIGLFIIDKEMK
jgi:CopG family nickel-responsive transcriptional regulator